MSTLVFPTDFVPGESPAMRRLADQMQPLVRGDAPVLLLGETGVGKELIAQTLHASSQRRRGPFVPVNCAAIPGELMEAEMFGIGKGVASGVVARAGQFQLAQGGTLFLDEIGEMPLPLQAKLLRALQGCEIQPVGGAPLRVDTRVVAATNADLERKMERGRFRRDLYYRVAAFVLHVPPLRERREDVPGLVRAFAGFFAQEAGRPTPRITADAMCALAAYAWPGHVRELQHEVRRLVYLCPEGRAIDRGLLSEHVLAAPPTDVDVRTSSFRLDIHVAALERRLIQAALARTGNRRAAAARLLGISRNGLAIKMARLGVAQGDRP